MGKTTRPPSHSPILILVIAAFTLSPSGAPGQIKPLQTRGSFPADRVLAKENPPLTDSMVLRFIDLLCWLLEIPKTPQKLALLRLEWATSSEADRQKVRAQWRATLLNAPEKDPQWVTAAAAAERASALMKKDPKTVTEQELQEAAKDNEMVARECRRPGSPAYDLNNAAIWEQRVSEYRSGLGTYRQIAAMNAAAPAQQQAAANQALIHMQILNQLRYNNQLNNSLNAMNAQADANGRNAAAHVNNSPADWVVPRVP